ncbi:MAG: hypothetical protein M1281_10480 [Chloroflexi bacterium]|nr:hypothetical protein [Chloroflexota bacterium]
MINISELSDFLGGSIEVLGFEKGITLKHYDEGWGFQYDYMGDPILLNLDDITNRFLPIYVKYHYSEKQPTITLMFCPDGKLAPGIQPFSLPKQEFIKVAAIRYIADALHYHVMALHSQYEIILNKNMRFSFIASKENINSYTFMDQASPYYEFDALLAVARRAYDTCRYLLWNAFKPGKDYGTVPRSFERTIPLCSNLDPLIRKDLQSSWDKWGSRLTSYRDCIMHYCPVDFGMSNVFLHQEFPNVWTVRAPIPDNPNARSKDKFTYKDKIDALSFGWNLACEILCVLRTVVIAVSNLSTTPTTSNE